MFYTWVDRVEGPPSFLVNGLSPFGRARMMSQWLSDEERAKRVTQLRRPSRNSRGRISAFGPFRNTAPVHGQLVLNRSSGVYLYNPYRPLLPAAVLSEWSAEALALPSQSSFKGRAGRLRRPRNGSGPIDLRAGSGQVRA